MGKKSREKRERRAKKERLHRDYRAHSARLVLGADVGGKDFSVTATHIDAADIVKGPIESGWVTLKSPPRNWGKGIVMDEVHSVHDSIVGTMRIDEMGLAEIPKADPPKKPWEEQKVGRGKGAHEQRVEKLRHAGFVELLPSDDGSKFRQAGLKIIQPLTNHPGFVHKKDLRLVETVRGILHEPEEDWVKKAYPNLRRVPPQQMHGIVRPVDVQQSTPDELIQQLINLTEAGWSISGTSTDLEPSTDLQNEEGATPGEAAGGGSAVAVPDDGEDGGRHP